MDNIHHIREQAMKKASVIIKMMLVRETRIEIADLKNRDKEFDLESSFLSPVR